MPVIGAAAPKQPKVTPAVKAVTVDSLMKAGGKRYQSTPAGRQDAYSSVIASKGKLSDPLAAVGVDFWKPTMDALQKVAVTDRALISQHDFDRLFVGQVRPSCPVKAAQHGALPLLQRLPDVGLKEAVARGHAVAGGVARRHRIAVVLRAGHRFDVRRGACRTASRKRSASTG